MKNNKKNFKMHLRIKKSMQIKEVERVVWIQVKLNGKMKKGSFERNKRGNVKYFGKSFHDF